MRRLEKECVLALLSTYLRLGARTFAFLGDEVMMMTDLGPLKDPSVTSMVAVLSALVNTKILVFAFTAVTVVHPPFGYSDWKKA